MKNGSLSIQQFFLKSALLLVVSFIFSSCLVLHSGNISSGPLLSVNDKNVAVASGKAQAYALFFIGLEYSDKMILNAKQNMYKNRPLQNGEYYANFTCDITKKLILGFYYETVVTVSADVLKKSE